MTIVIGPEHLPYLVVAGYLLLGLVGARIFWTFDNGSSTPNEQVFLTSVLVLLWPFVLITIAGYGVGWLLRFLCIPKDKRR